MGICARDNEHAFAVGTVSVRPESTKAHAAVSKFAGSSLFWGGSSCGSLKTQPNDVCKQ